MKDIYPEGNPKCVSKTECIDGELSSRSLLGDEKNQPSKEKCLRQGKGGEPEACIFLCGYKKKAPARPRQLSLA